MGEISSLKDYKKSKKNKVIVFWFEKTIIYVYNLSIQALKHFKHYQSVMESDFCVYKVIKHYVNYIWRNWR